MDKKADVAKKISLGVLTGGVSLLPDAVKAVKGISNKESKVDEPDEEVEEDIKDEQE